jgi:hypothetical protein
MAGHITHGLGRQGNWAIPLASMGLGRFIVGEAGYLVFTWATRKLRWSW